MENGSLPVVLRQSKTPFLKDPNTLLMTQVVTFPAQSSLHYCTWLSVFLLQKTWSVLLTCLYECLFRDGASALPIMTEGTISQTSHSLRGRLLKAKGKGVLGARETRGGRPKPPFLSFQTPATQAKHHIQESDWLSFTLCSVKDNTIKNVLRHHERWNWQRVGASQKTIPRERWINHNRGDRGRDQWAYKLPLEKNIQSVERLTVEREVPGSIPGARPILRILK